MSLLVDFLKVFWFLIAFAFFVGYLLRDCSEGYEDETGYHSGKKDR